MVNLWDGLLLGRVLKCQSFNILSNDLAQQIFNRALSQLAATPDDPMVDQLQIVRKVVDSKHKKLTSLLNPRSRGAIYGLFDELAPNPLLPRYIDWNYGSINQHHFDQMDGFFWVPFEAKNFLLHIIRHCRVLSFELVLELLIESLGLG